VDFWKLRNALSSGTKTVCGIEAENESRPVARLGFVLSKLVKLDSCG